MDSVKVLGENKQYMQKISINWLIDWSYMSADFENKVVIITGGAQGIRDRGSGIRRCRLDKGVSGAGDQCRRCR